MAEAAATTTRPSRARKAAPAKATPAKAAAAKAEAAAPTAETVDRFTVAFEHTGTTKSYERFDAPKNMKGVVVGSVYAPPGTLKVGVVVIGAEAPATE